MRPADATVHCRAETDKYAPMRRSILGRTSILSSVLAHFLTTGSDYETDRVLQGRRQQMAGAFCASTLPTYSLPLSLSLTPTLFFLSTLSVPLSIFALSFLRASGVKFTNPYGAPRASNKRFSLFLTHAHKHTLSLFLWLLASTYSLRLSICMLLFPPTD